MKLSASLDDRIGKLVHPDIRVRTSVFAIHRSFIATRLALSLASLAAAPLCFVAGAPPAWEAAAMAWLSLPLAAVAVVSRSGDLRLGEALSLATWIGLAVTVALGTGAALGLTLLLMIAVETAALAALPSRAGMAAAGVAAVMLTLRWHLMPPAGAAIPTPVAFAALAAAFSYACLLAGVANGLTRRGAAEEQASRARFDQLAEAIDDVVLCLDRSGRVRHSGSAAVRLFGLDPRELAGRGLLERLHVADRPSYLKLAADVAASREPRTATLRLRTGRTMPSARGSYVEPVFAWVDLAIRPMPAAPDGDTMALMRDVSGRIDGERRAADAQAVSERALIGRDLLLANVSHELRTPLNAIIGFAEMLSSEALAPDDGAKRREYATIIQQSGLHLLSVVNGILDATKIESGRFDVFPMPFDLGRLVGQCCDMVGLKAEQASVRLVRAFAPGMADLVGDERACRQILLNLLSNALKFTPAGGEVSVAVRPDGAAVLIAVSDTGVGVSAQDLPRLGDPFFQARGRRDRPADGTGLGLSVVRGLVGLHGGTMVIESAPGQGTRVVVRLPVDGRRGPPGAVTKIETIPRYSSISRHGEAPGGGRMHRLA